MDNVTPIFVIWDQYTSDQCRTQLECGEPNQPRNDGTCNLGSIRPAPPDGRRLTARTARLLARTARLTILILKSFKCSQNCLLRVFFPMSSKFNQNKNHPKTTAVPRQYSRGIKRYYDVTGKGIHFRCSYCPMPNAIRSRLCRYHIGKRRSLSKSHVIINGKGRHQKNSFFLGHFPKLWVGGGQES